MNKHKTLTDDELSSLLKQGDEKAYTEIYDRYWQTVYTIAYNRLRNLEAAEDLVHDTFASVWTNREKINILNLKSYLGVAVKYRVFEYIRVSKLQLQYEQKAPRQSNAFSAADEAMHCKHLLKLLDQEIESLPDKCKLIFKYSRQHHKSSREIAAELDLSQSTVENQLNKALNRLRVVLKHINLLMMTLF